MKEANLYNLFDLKAFEEKLKLQVDYCICKDENKWDKSYECKPSFFIEDKNSIFYEENKKLVKSQCKLIEKTQLLDGTWNVTWDWCSYPEQWPIAKNWWKSDIIIKNLKFLKVMNKLN